MVEDVIVFSIVVKHLFVFGISGAKDIVCSYNLII